MFNPIQLNTFTERTGIGRRELIGIWDHADRIVSLRDIRKVLSIQAMSKDYLRRLLDSVSLAGHPDMHPYRDCRIQTMRVDPRSLMVGQTFIERRKYSSLLEEFPNVFDDHCISKGYAKLTALIVLGLTEDDSVTLAHYLPPIIEQHGARTLLMDGVHRNFIALSTGTTVETIRVHDVRCDFPCSPQRWDSVQAVDEKPPKEERFFNLQPELFRDIKSVGIDG